MADEPKQPFRGPAGPEGTDAPEVDEVAAAKAANRFDIRRIIGGLFLLYRAILVEIAEAGVRGVEQRADRLEVAGVQCCHGALDALVLAGDVAGPGPQRLGE